MRSIDGNNRDNLQPQNIFYLRILGCYKAWFISRIITFEKNICFYCYYYNYILKEGYQICCCFYINYLFFWSNWSYRNITYLMRLSWREPKLQLKIYFYLLIQSLCYHNWRQMKNVKNFVNTLGWKDNQFIKAWLGLKLSSF